jgi:DNA mismatch repair protein MutL
MADIIQLLPDSVANQIAAGEVIQRPASVVKELVENAVDAGSTSITVIVKEGGKNLVQVIDNGSGMSGTDARMAFERHATSKIRQANDLFSIRTMGFRGEALASIAAIAEVNLKTRRATDELGSEIIIAGTEVRSQEPVQCSTGSNFSIKNLFYNVPARRKFLKSTATELRNIVYEFQRIALAFPSLELALVHNQEEVFNLPKANLRQRIVSIFGKNINPHLIDIRTETTIVKISGFVGKPEAAKKSFGEQYFFVNQRYVRHPYFHKAVMQAYEKLIAPDMVPSYFIFFEIDPANIDVNIHPTKTEIKFEDEQAIWQILHAAIRESLGRFNLTPSLDFETGGIIDIPVLTKDTVFIPPEIQVNTHYNPFEEEDKFKSSARFKGSMHRDPNLNWEKLYEGFESASIASQADTEQANLGINQETPGDNFFVHFKNRYILTPVKSGLMFIDQKRAHERILYEQYMRVFSNGQVASQQNLFPQTIQLNSDEYMVLAEIQDQLQALGFEIGNLGNNTMVVNGYPTEVMNSDPIQILRHMLAEYMSRPVNLKEDAKERMALALSTAMAIPYGRPLNMEEMKDIIDRLFACSVPGHTPDGKAIVFIYPSQEVEKRFG